MAMPLKFGPLVVERRGTRFPQVRVFSRPAAGVAPPAIGGSKHLLYLALFHVGCAESMHYRTMSFKKVYWFTTFGTGARQPPER